MDSTFTHLVAMCYAPPGKAGVARWPTWHALASTAKSRGVPQRGPSRKPTHFAYLCALAVTFGPASPLGQRTRFRPVVPTTEGAVPVFIATQAKATATSSHPLNV